MEVLDRAAVVDNRDEKEMCRLFGSSDRNFEASDCRTGEENDTLRPVVKAFNKHITLHEC